MRGEEKEKGGAMLRVKATKDSRAPDQDRIEEEQEWDLGLGPGMGKWARVDSALWWLTHTHILTT